MDASAIEIIQQKAIEAAKANRLDTAVPGFIYGNQVVSLEKMHGKRAYFRGQFRTSMLSEFASYVRDHGGHCFIDSTDCLADAVHNLGSTDAPGAADWTSCLTLKKKSAYAALAICERALTQKQLVEWLEDWAPYLATMQYADDDAVTPVANGLRAIRTLNIKQTKDTTYTDKDFGASRSSLEDIEASAKVGLPYGFVMTTEPYQGFNGRDFVLRLSVLTGDDPRLKLRVVSAEKIEEDIAQEFRGLLLDAIGDNATIHIGTFTP